MITVGSNQTNFPMLTREARLATQHSKLTYFLKSSFILHSILGQSQPRCSRHSACSCSSSTLFEAGSGRNVSNLFFPPWDDCLGSHGDQGLKKGKRKAAHYSKESGTSLPARGLSSPPLILLPVILSSLGPHCRHLNRTKTSTAGCLGLDTHQNLAQHCYCKSQLSI